MRLGRWRWWGVLLLLSFLAVPMSTAVAVENESYGLTPQPERKDGMTRRAFSIPLESGAVFEDSVRVYNRTPDQTLDLAVYAADAEAGVDGTISVGFRGSRPTGVGGWIDLSRDQVSLPPRGETIITFRVEVRSADPSPELGAIVVENTARGIAADLAQRLHLVVRTAPPNSPTTSARVRPLLLRSPWVIIALLGLLVALIIVWLGARRARRLPKDAVLPSGELVDDTSDVQPASRPVLRRLGEAGKDRRQRPTRPLEKQAPPLVDEELTEFGRPEEEEEDDEPVRVPRRPRQRATRATRPASSDTDTTADRKKTYIPLEDL
jgi:hypothetical protein